MRVSETFAGLHPYTTTSCAKWFDIAASKNETEMFGMFKITLSIAVLVVAITLVGELTVSFKLKLVVSGSLLLSASMFISPMIKN